MAVADAAVIFLIHRKLRPMNQKRSARMHMLRRGKWLQKQPRGSAEVPQAELFILYRIASYELKMLRDDAYVPHESGIHKVSFQSELCCQTEKIVKRRKF